MKILIVDDNADFLEVLETYLDWQQHDVVKAEDGLQGLNQLLESPASYDLILSDFSMPAMDGLELLQEVRERQFDIPVIFISASYDIDLYQQAAALDLRHWLRKPFDFEDLDELLNEVNSQKPLYPTMPLASGNARSLGVPTTASGKFPFNPLPAAPAVLAY